MKGMVIIMKKTITLFLCLCIFILPTTVALADNESLEGTTWELGMILVMGTEEYLDLDYILANNLMITFYFGANGAVTLSTPNRDYNGTYQLSINELDIDFGNDGNIWTVIAEGESGLLMFMFVDVFEEGQAHLFILTDGTFGGVAPAVPVPEPEPAPATPAPATPEPRPTPAPSVVDSTPEPEQPESPATSPAPSSTSDSGMPRWMRDALVGGALGAVVGFVMWLIGRNKKKKKEAAAAASMPQGVDSMSPGYYPMAGPAPVAPAPATMAPINAQRQLYCQSGPMAGGTFPINGTLRIGRNPSQCQIVFPADAGGISSLHCELQQQQSGVLLVDRGSTYGTFLQNGRKLNSNESVALNPGDGFYLADIKYSFKVL